MGSIAFTGNRDYTDPASLYRGLDQVRADRYFFGGARGADTDALKYIARTQPLTERIVVVPNRLADQPIKAHAVIRAHATSVIELGNTGPGRYQIRNQYMVDHADRVLAFTDGRKSGGTFNTIQYAIRQGKVVDYVQWYNFDVNVIYGKSEVELLQWLKECALNEVPELVVKGMVVGAMKKFPRSSWPNILDELHRLR